MAKENECKQCGGSGQEIVGENRVSLDMAIDAGDNRSMEGMFHSYAYEVCSACEGSGIELTLSNNQVRKAKYARNYSFNLS